MKLGFTDSQVAIMTAAAISENLLMIDKRDNGKPQGCMAGLAIISGSDVIAYFR